MYLHYYDNLCKYSINLKYFQMTNQFEQLTFKILFSYL